MKKNFIRTAALTQRRRLFEARTLRMSELQSVAGQQARRPVCRVMVEAWSLMPQSASLYDGCLEVQALMDAIRQGF